MSTNRSITKYQETLTEDLVTAYAVILGIHSLLTFISLLVSYLLGIFTFSQSVKTRKELTKYSTKISQIVQEQITCYLVQDKTPNAFNAGGKTCYMTTALYNMLTDKEIISVFLHEYGHYQKLHIYKTASVHFSSSILILAVVDFASIVFLGLYFPAFVVILGLIFGRSVADWYAKRNELEADEVAVKFGYRDEFISALKKLEAYTRKDVCKKLSKKDCESFFEDLQKNGTHPAFKDRYEHILSLPSVAKAIAYFAKNIHSNGWSQSLSDKIKSFVTSAVNLVSKFSPK